jgi:magnesium transporter
VAIIIAIIGAVTVVVSSNPSDVRLTPKALIHAISQRVFIVYSCIYAVGAIVLTILSEGRLGEEYVFVDVGLCALFGESNHI